MFNWITSFVEQSGYLGIALLMLAETVFPPIPSELIMPLSGFIAARGELGLVPVILTGTAGSVAGTSIWYFLGRRFGMDRLKSLAAQHGRWLTLSPQELEQAERFFARHCGKAVFLGRLLPAVRTLISIPAGIVGMAFGRFLLYSAAGSLLWTTLLAGAGYLLEAQYEAVSQWLNPITNVVIGAGFAWYLYRVITFRPERA